MAESTYDLGLFQLCNQDIQLFAEFIADDPVHRNARRLWDDRCRKTKGHCGLIVASGITGAARGNPGLKDMMAFFEARATTSEEMGFGTLYPMTQDD